MGCTSCGGGLSKKGKKFVWTGPNGQTATYQSEIEAKAKVMRQGGTYRAVNK